jgi:hypothetical protein
LALCQGNDRAVAAPNYSESANVKSRPGRLSVAARHGNPLSAIRFLLPKDFASFTIDQAKSNRSTRPRNMSRFAYGLGRIQSAPAQ